MAIQSKENTALGNLIRRTLLRNFLSIQLTSSERELAEEAIEEKYSIAIRKSFYNCLLLIPCLLLLDTSIVVSVLIPTTMVAGTAWFSVSLASLKEKFSGFGLELTVDLFNAFCLSLTMLFTATALSLTRPLWEAVLSPYLGNPISIAIAACLGTFVVGSLLFSIFSGSLRYDINDAMLTGQNEAAERYFKQSLSVLHNASQALRGGRSLHVANYLIGVAFFEVFNDIGKTSTKSDDQTISSLVSKANLLIREPSMDESDANRITIELIENFLSACETSVPDSKKHKSTIAIKDEINCLKATVELAPTIRSNIEEQFETMKGRISKEERENPIYLHHLKQQIVEYVHTVTEKSEDQEMTDLRISVVLDEVTNLVEEFGHLIVVLPSQISNKSL